MNGYLIIAVALFSLLIGAFCGWDWTKDHYQAEAAAAEARAIIAENALQAKISVIDNKSTQDTAAEDAKTLKLIGEETHEKTLNKCKLSPATVRLLNSASRPAYNLPR